MYMVEHIEHRFTTADFAPQHKALTFEVEEQAKLDPDQHLAIQEHIVRLGGTHAADEFIQDEFFCPADITSYDELEKRALNEQIIRIRKSIRQDYRGDTVTTTTLTTKAMQKGEGAAWDEHVFSKTGDHFSEASHLLTTGAGLKPYYKISKSRSEWQLGNTTISFDAIPDYGIFMEAELQKKKADIPAARSELKRLMETLGVRADQKPKQSIMKELVRTRSFT